MTTHVKLVWLSGCLLLGLGLSWTVGADGRVAAGAPTAAGTNLFPEGSFEVLKETGDPEGWALPDKQDKPWKAGTCAEVVAEDGNRFLRITTVPEHPSFYALFANVPWIPDGKTHVRVSLKMRARIHDKPEGAPWRGFRAHLGFATEPGRSDGRNWALVGDRRLLTMDVQDTTEEWIRCVESRELPQGAKYICVRIMVGGLVGTFDVDDVVLTTE